MKNAATIINTKIVKNTYDAYWQDVLPYTTTKLPSRVLVLVNAFSKDSNEEVLLKKMLDACKLQPNQYNIIPIPTAEKVAWHQLRDRLQPKYVFLLGIHPFQLGISAMFILNEPNRFNDCIWLPALTLNDIESNKDMKIHLWNNGMKPIFIDHKYGKI